MSTGYPSNLSDAEWKCLQGYLPPLPKRGRPPIHSLRAIFDAIFYVLRTGCPWRYLPANFPPWQTVFYHFRRLRIKGTWTLLLRALHRAERERQGRHPDPSAESRDSQSVKTVEESSGICGYDAHKHIKERKRHILVDTLGIPISIYVTPADTHDTRGARCLLAGLTFARTPPLQRSGRIVPTAAGVGHLVSGNRRVGVGRSGTPHRHPWLKPGASQMGRRTHIQLDCSQPEHEQGRRAKGPDQPNANRGGDDPAAGHSFGVQERTSSQTLHDETITLPLPIAPLPLSRSVLRTGKRVLASSLVILRQLFQPFPLLLVMTENHKPDLLPFGQIKQFHRTGADRFGVRVAPVVLLVTGKALAEGDRVNRQYNRPRFGQPHQHRLMSRHMPARLNQLQPRQQFRVPVHQPNALHWLIPLGSIGSKTWVARRIQMMHTLNNIVRLRECRVSSGMVDIIMRRNDGINIVRF